MEEKKKREEKIKSIFIFMKRKNDIDQRTCLQIYATTTTWQWNHYAAFFRGMENECLP